MAASKRNNPTKPLRARVGNYAADVDTAGMDPEMKETMKGARPETPLTKLMGLFKKKKGKS